MLPENFTTETVEVDSIPITGTYNIITGDTDLKNTPKTDWANKKFVMENGTPKLINDIQSIKDWITLFIMTPKNCYEIYEGTGFGTSIQKLFGRKIIGNGYEESEVEREIREGMTLNPAISSVTSFNMYKNGRKLIIQIQVELYDGTLVNTVVEDILTVKI